MTAKKHEPEYLVLAGIDADDKPRAARFPGSENGAVRKAAELMGLRVGRASGEAAIKLVRKLPEGRIFATGKALAPLVKPALYDELLKTVHLHDVGGNAKPADGAAKAGSETRAHTSPGETGNANAKTAKAEVPGMTELLNGIGVGSVVLCPYLDENPQPMWSECIVTAISKDGKTLTLRFRDYANYDPFTAPRMAVTLLPPEEQSVTGGKRLS
jgi:hypothetical protein